MEHILTLTESNVDVATDEQTERALPGFTQYRETIYHKYMLGRYLYSLKYLKNKTVLDCACGLGWGSFLISDYPKKLLSIDLNKNALEFAKKTWKDEELNFIQHSALDLEGLNNKFDVILAFELIEHLQISDGVKLFQQANQALTENGLMILSSSFPSSQKSARRKEQRNKFHLHIYTKEEMKDLLTKSGFSKPRFLGSFMLVAANRKNSKS